MININGEEWRIALVAPLDPVLRRSDGNYTIGVCDDIVKTIFINKELSQKYIQKVLCHELTHAAMFSYNIELTCSEETATSVADGVINKLSGQEKKVAIMFYKKGYNNVAISEELSVSVDKVTKLLKGVRDKISHPSYNENMKEFVKVKKLYSTNAMEKLKEIVGIKDKN